MDTPQTSGRLTFEGTTTRRKGRKYPQNSTVVIARCSCGVRAWIEISVWKRGTVQCCSSCARESNALRARDTTRWFKGWVR